MNKVPIYIFIIVLLASCNQKVEIDEIHKKPSEIEKKDVEKNEENVYSYTVIPLENGEYGYNILHHGNMYIHQPHIPAIEGTSGFKNPEQAETTARFIIQKIKQNIIPPTVSKAELDSLGVL